MARKKLTKLGMLYLSHTTADIPEWFLLDPVNLEERVRSLVEAGCTVYEINPLRWEGGRLERLRIPWS